MHSYKLLLCPPAEDGALLCLYRPRASLAWDDLPDEIQCIIMSYFVGYGYRMADEALREFFTVSKSFARVLSKKVSLLTVDSPGFELLKLFDRSTVRMISCNKCSPTSPVGLIGRFTALRGLQMCLVPEVQLMPWMKLLVHLECLNLQHVKDIPDTEFMFFAEMPQLSYLQLDWGGHITDRVVIEGGLSRCTRLRHLSIRGVLGGDGFLTGTGAQHFSTLTALTGLHLTNHKDIGHHWPWLTSLTNLTVLDIDWCRLNDSFAPYLKPLKKLEHLSVTGNNWSDEFLLKTLGYLPQRGTPSQVPELRFW